MHWDHEADVVVVGAGAAGLTAGIRAADLGLEVLIIEKSDVWGGSASMSAGLVWVPTNSSMLAQGIEDSEDDGVRYLAHLTGGTIAPDRLRTFVHEANRMVEYLTEHSRVQFHAVPDYPDYHPEDPGGRPGGRSLEPRAIDGTKLGEAFTTLHATYPALLMMGKAMVTVKQSRGLLNPGVRAKLPLLLRVRRFIHDTPKRRRHHRDPFLTMGQALAARLRLSLIDRGVPLWLSAPVERLEVDGGRVVGVTIERDCAPVSVRARLGVIVAAGGFEHNAEMRARYQRQSSATAWTVGNAANTGDGIQMAAAVGARLDTDLMREAWWLPATPAPGLPAPSLLVVEKNLPHSIFVDRTGRRFVNEASSYTDIVLEMYRRHEQDGATIPAWFVFDGRYRAKYFVGPLLPRFVMKDAKLPPALQPGGGWLHRAPTVEGLAGSIGVDAAVLRATVDRFNEFARTGVDDDFQRGVSANDRYYADASNRPNPSVGTIVEPPFYAVPIVPSDLGTKAGLVTDNHARVLGTGGEPIAGLYAAGNCATTVMGNRYPGAGSTIAPAMTFGFLAAETCATDGGVDRPADRSPTSGAQP